jgi:hypothetical protein
MRCDNASFDADRNAEIAYILRESALRHLRILEPGESQFLLDRNGNKIGFIELCE